MSPSPSDPTRLHRLTPDTPGAVALLQLTGPGAAGIVERFTGTRPTTTARLVRFGDIDEGLIVGLGERWCQLMPHGGPRVVQRLTAALLALGAVVDDAADPTAAYPEAANEMEAMALATMADAASPAAIDRLLDQPAIWRAFLESPDPDWEAVARHSDRWRALIHPPTVALVGRANVGKSTLTNLVTGRTASITADLPGTTRDWVAGLATLPIQAVGDVVVQWFDTPGLRASDDALEQRAIALARQALAQADLLLAMRDPQMDWPATADLPRQPDLWLLNKADLLDDADGALTEPHPEAGRRAEHPLPISATHDRGLERLSECIGDRLGLTPSGETDQRTPTLPWAFNRALQDMVDRRDHPALADLLTLRAGIASDT